MDIEQLRALPLFDGLSDEELAGCAEHFTEFAMIEGNSLAKQDDYAYKFFIVLEGEVDVHRDFQYVATLGPGEFFGEVALVKHEQRNARVTTKSRSRLACMMGWDFRDMTERFPTIAERIEAVVHDRET
jgi:CRP-like cAMP-binding protein